MKQGGWGGLKTNCFVMRGEEGRVEVFADSCEFSAQVFRPAPITKLKSSQKSITTNRGAHMSILINIKTKLT